MKPQTAPNQFVPQLSHSTELQLWQRVNYLLGELGQMKQELAQARFSEGQIKCLQTQIQAASDSLTQLQTFVGKGSTQFVSTSDSLSASGVGMTITGAIGSGTIAISNAASFRSAISAAAKASPAIVGATITLAKITGGGTDGSITVNAEGIVTAYVQPT